MASPAAPAALSRRQVNVVFTAILLGMLLAALDQTIVSTALPTIVADLGGAGHMAWVVTSYLLAETVATVLAGKFGFGIAWFLEQLPLRDSARSPATDVGEGFSTPTDRVSPLERPRTARDPEPRRRLPAPPGRRVAGRGDRHVAGRVVAGPGHGGHPPGRRP
jgi:MFS family permease